MRWAPRSACQRESHVRDGPIAHHRLMPRTSRPIRCPRGNAHRDEALPPNTAESSCLTRGRKLRRGCPVCVKGKARVPWAHADHRPTEHRLARPRRLLERRSSCLGRAAFELDTTAAKRQYGQRRVVCADFRFDQSASRERLASPSSSASLCYVESYRLVAARKRAPWPRTLTPAAGSDLSGARTGDGLLSGSSCCVSGVLDPGQGWARLGR